jgi:hypothetical protein
VFIVTREALVRELAKTTLAGIVQTVRTSFVTAPKTPPRQPLSTVILV